jgi:hypothetical protein
LTASPKPPWAQQSGEPEPSFQRFQAYLELGPSRSLAAIAKSVGVSRQAVAQTAERWNWAARSASWDDYQVLRVTDCPAPGRLQDAAAAPPIAAVVSDEVREAERAFMALVEEFRAAVEALGKGQLVTARLMTEKARRSAAALLQDDRPLPPSQLPGFVSAAANLAAAAQHQWGRALGVNALLDRMDAGLAAMDVEALDD